MQSNEEKKAIKILSLLFVIAVFYTLLVYLLVHKAHISLANQLLLTKTPYIILDMTFIGLCIALARKISGLWKIFIILLGIAAILSIFLTVLSFGTAPSSHAGAYYPIDDTAIMIIHGSAIAIQIIAWGLISGQLVATARNNLSKLTPFIPTVITATLAIVFIIAPFSNFTGNTDFATWKIIIACRDIVLFVLIIFCLAMLRDLQLTILATGFLIIIIATTLPHGADAFCYLLGRFFIIFSAYKLVFNEEARGQHILYSVDSTRTQIIYWGNSIAAILFLLIGTKIYFIDEQLSYTDLIFNSNIKLLIPFMSLLSLLTIFFARMFSQDYYRIKMLIASFTTSTPKALAIFNKLNFIELRQFSKFLQHKMELISEKTANQKKLFKVVGQAAHDIRTPLSVLSILSDEVEQRLDHKEWLIYKNALARINVTANDLLALQGKSADDDNREQTKLSQSKYIAILFLELMQQKSIQYVHLGVTVEYHVAPSAWFVITNIATHHFFRVLSNLINHAIAATKEQQQKIISCQIKYQAAEPYFTLSVKDSGPGLTDSDINAIVSEEKTEHGLNYVMKKVRQWKGSTRIDSEPDQGTEINIILPLTQPTPKWWMDTITLPPSGDIIIFDDDPLAHKQWENILAPYIKKDANIILHSCFNEQQFIEALELTEDKLVLMDYDIEGCPKLGLDYIKEFHLKDCAILVTNNFHHSEVQNQCATDGVALLPKPLISHVEIK